MERASERVSEVCRDDPTYKEPYGGWVIIFHDEVCVLSFGRRSRINLDSVILREATSLQRRNILMLNEVFVIVVSEWWTRMWSPNGVSLVLFFASRRCLLNRRRICRFVSPT